MAGGRAGPGPGRPARDVHLDATSAGPPGTRAGRGGLADSGTRVMHEIIPDYAQRPAGIP